MIKRVSIRGRRVSGKKGDGFDRSKKRKGNIAEEKRHPSPSRSLDKKKRRTSLRRRKEKELEKLPRRKLLKK